MFPLFRKSRSTKSGSHSQNVRKLNLEKLEERVNPSLAFGYATGGYEPGATGTSAAEAVATDSAGDVYVVGTFDLITNFDGTPETARGISDTFVEKIFANGTLDWVADLGGNGGYVKGVAIAVDNSGNVFTTGTFQGNNLNFDPNSNNEQLSSSDSGTNVNAFVSELSSSGQFVFASVLGANATAIQPSAIAIDSSDNVYTVGSFTGSGVDFGNGHLLTSSSDGDDSNAYVSKLDSTGQFSFVDDLGYGAATAYGYGIAVDASGNVFTTGKFSGTNASLDPTGNHSLNSEGGYNVFVSKLSTSGAYINAEDIVYNGNASGNAITVDNSDNVYVTGVFTGNNVNFDPNNSSTNEMTSSATGYRNAFVAEYNSSGDYVFAVDLGYGGLTSGSSPGATGQSIVVDSSGNIFTAGSFAGIARNFNPINNTDPLTSAQSGASSNAYVSELNSSGQDVFGVDLGYNGIAYGNGIWVDGAGNVFTAGYFEGSGVNFNPLGNDVLYSTPSNQSSYFLSKLTTNGPSITSDPSSVTIDAGQNATLSTAATGIPAPTEQWQVSTDGGTTFTNVTNGGVYSGATTTTLTITDASASMDQNEYQVIFTNSVGKSTTTPATLTVDFSPYVTTQPVNASAAVGGTATFTAVAAGEPAPSVQWQVSTNGGLTFTNTTDGVNYSGSTTPTLTVTGLTSSMNGDEYQAVFSNTVLGATTPGTATTNSATLTSDFPVTVTASPTNQTVAAGSNATFTVGELGSPAPAVQWMVSINGGVSYSTVSNGGVYSGATTTALTITGAPPSLNSSLYEAVLTNEIPGASAPTIVTSFAASLTVDYAPTITTNPVNTTIKAGTNVSLVAVAPANPAPTVEWLVSTDGGGTYNVVSNSNIYSDATTPSLGIIGATPAMNGYEYIAIFSNTLAGASSPSTATTIPVTLTVDYAPTITTNPTSQTISNPGNATFTAGATSGFPVATNVQWQLSTNNGVSFVNLTNNAIYSGVTTTTLTVTGATNSYDLYQYRASFSNAGNLISATSYATLYVQYAPIVTLNPANTTALVGHTATFTANALGDPIPAIQWLGSFNGSSFNFLGNNDNYSGVNTSTLTVRGITLAMNGWRFEAQFYDNVAQTIVTTKSATLTAIYQSQYTGIAYTYTYAAYLYAFDAYISGLGSYNTFVYEYYAYVDALGANSAASAGNQSSALNYAYYAYYYGYYGQYYAYLDYALSGGASVYSYYAYIDGYYGQYYSYFAAQGL